MPRLASLLWLAFGCIFLFSGGPARAWGEFGHVLICEIAYRTMSDDARAKLNELIDAQDLRDEHGEKLYPSYNHACLREDEVRKRPSEHYINYPRSQAGVTDDTCPGGGKCLLSAIEQDRATLDDKNASSTDRFIALMALGHWVGDIHQPLHVSFADDRGGNDIAKRGRCSARNLHAVWDSCIIEQKILTVEQPVNVEEYAEFTPMYRAADWMVAEVTPEQRASWAASQPWQWAAESFDIARDPAVGYCIRKAGGCWYSETAETYGGLAEGMRRVDIDDSYFEQFRKLTAMRIEQAGIRLASMVEEALRN